jgi:zinc transport system substrate-binding protein
LTKYSHVAYNYKRKCEPFATRIFEGDLMFRKITALLISIAAILAVSSCSPKPGVSDDGKIQVAVSFDALKEFAEAVGGDKVAVHVIIPDGTEPHAFEPKAQDLTALGSADIFIINGLGMESWAEEAVKASKNTALIVVDASSGVDAIAHTEDAHEDADADAHEEDAEDGHHEHGAYDPHIWLSPKSAETMAANIRDALIKHDSENKEAYTSNCDRFVTQLETLYTDYSAKFAAVTDKSFVTGHAAFAYFCRDFGLEQNSVEDVFAEGEPTARQLAALVEYCRAHHVTTIFSEALVSADVSEALAREVGAEVKPIYTMASAENGKSYLERMGENLKVIYESLK